MGTGGRTTETGDAGADDNVIRFPRDWFGSKEDLVPFGPAADRLEAEAAAASAGAAADLDVDEDLSSALNANDFWGGGSGALHQPVDALPDDAPYVTGAAAEPPAYEEPLIHLVVDDDPQADLVPTMAVPAQAARLTVGVDRPRPGRRRRPARAASARSHLSSRVAVGAALAAVVMVIAAIGMAKGSGTPHRSNSPASALAIAKQTQATAPDVSSVARLSSASVALADRAHTRASTAKLHKKHAAKVVRKHRTTVTHRAPVTPTTAAQSAPAVSSDATTDDVSEAPSPSGSSSSVSSGTTAASGTQGGSTASSSGPGGLGGAVGSNCNPICSAQ